MNNPPCPKCRIELKEAVRKPGFWACHNFQCLSPDCYYAKDDERLSLPIPANSLELPKLRTGDRVKVLDEQAANWEGAEYIITVDCFDSSGIWDKAGTHYEWSQVIEYL